MKKLFFTATIIASLLLASCSAKTASSTHINQPENTAASTNASVAPSENVKYNFRNTSWGMSFDKVKKSETGTFIDGNETSLLYGIKIANLNARAFYRFNKDGQLYDCYCFIEERHTNLNTYLDDYSTLYNALFEKYGKPIDEKDAWSNDLYKNDPSDYGMAVAAGHYKKMAHFETSDTNINLLIMGDNFKINTSVAYVSKNIQAPPSADSGV